ncbi:MAG: hypothetical protein WKF67_13855 [Rubrobacteraceae bacterium]
MGQTSQCIDWGIEHGIDGQGAIPNFTERLHDYVEPYIGGYMLGFRLRKAGVTERRKTTDDQYREEARLWRMSGIPMYPQRWEWRAMSPIKKKLQRREGVVM